MKKIVIKYSTFILLLFCIFLYSSFLSPLFYTTQKTSFFLNPIDNDYIPFQNNFPYPSFEQQDRIHISLNTVWKYKKMKMDHDLSLKKRDEDTIKELEREAHHCYNIDFNDSSWGSIKLPAVNNPYPDRYQDGIWYRTTFQVPYADKNKLVKLIFQGANYITDVWINGKWVGTHEGGYTPFLFHVTPFLKWGEKNYIAVRVDNIPWLENNDTDKISNKRNIVPFKKCDWWNYGGIYRDVYLELSEKIYVVRADIKAEPVVTDKAQCQIKAYVHNMLDHNISVKASIKIFKTIINSDNVLSPKAYDIVDFKEYFKLAETNSLKQTQILPVDVGIIPFDIILKKVNYWSPNNPVLYVLEVTLEYQNKVMEKFYTQFGIRKIQQEERGEGFTLNDKPIFLAGVARHEDYFDSGRAFAFEDTKKLVNDLQFIKDMNANFIRTAHYPNHPMTYILADRMGLAIMEEVPVFWFGGPEFDLQREVRGIGRQMWLEMIYRDYNRPSILFWSTCNECGWQEERLSFIWDLKETANNIDGTRLVGQSASGNDPRDGTHRDCDYYGATMYYGVFVKGDTYGLTRHVMRDILSYYATKPFMATEYGIWSYDTFANVDEQVSIATNTYKAFREFSQVGGVAWWCAFDWYTMLGYPYQSMGTISLDRKFIKPVYFTLQKLYSQSKDDLSHINLTGVDNNQSIGDILKTQIDLGKYEKFIQAVSYKFFNTPFIPMEGREGIYSLQYNTKNLPEGKNYLIFNITYKNNDTFYIKRDIVIDNIDEPPVFESNMIDKKVYMDKLFLQVDASDDRSLPEVYYRIDQDDFKPISRTKNNTYFKDINLSHLSDKPSHKIEIMVKDKKQIEKRSYTFFIDRSPGIKINLPYNLDRISLNANRKDAFEWSLPAEELPKSDSWFVSQNPINAKFYLGSKEPGEKNVMESLGQSLKVTPGKYKAIHFLGYSYWGNQENNLTLFYSDGSREIKELSFSDWVGAHPYIENEYIGLLCSHYHCYEGDGDQAVAVYHRVIAVDSTKELVKIKMPYDNHKHILAVSLEP